MSEFIGHNCGVAAVVDLENKADVIPMLLRIIWQLQNRGDLGAGLSYVTELAEGERHIHTIKGPGKVSEVLSRERMRTRGAISSLGIAHTRYATNKNLDPAFFHPIDFFDEAVKYFGEEMAVEISLAFNGNFLLLQQLIELIKQLGITPRIGGDTEIMVQLLVHALTTESRDNMAAVFHKAFTPLLHGSFNPVILMKHAVFALCSPDKRHPMFFAQEGSFVAVASETAALRKLWPNAECFNIQPGQMLEINIRKKRWELHQLWKPNQKSCFIEQAYFEDHRSDSDDEVVVDSSGQIITKPGNSVSDSRYESGKVLAECDAEWIESLKLAHETEKIEKEEFIRKLHEKHGEKKCQKLLKKKKYKKYLRKVKHPLPMVSGVPLSALTAARAYGNEAGIPNVDSLGRNEDAGRSFMASTQAERQERAEKKYSYEEQFLEDRVVILIDDSMVRGTTMKTVVQKLRDNGAKEVHVRLATPPIMGPCFYGIDFPTVKELITRKYSNGIDCFKEDGTLHQEILDLIAKEIGADSVKFLPVLALPRTMKRKDASTICTSCIDCKHPDKGVQQLYSLACAEAGQ